MSGNTIMARRPQETTRLTILFTAVLLARVWIDQNYTGFGSIINSLLLAHIKSRSKVIRQLLWFWFWFYYGLRLAD